MFWTDRLWPTCRNVTNREIWKLPECAHSVWLMKVLCLCFILFSSVYLVWSMGKHLGCLPRVLRGQTSALVPGCKLFFIGCKKSIFFVFIYISWEASLGSPLGSLPPHITHAFICTHLQWQTLSFVRSGQLIPPNFTHLCVIICTSCCTYTLPCSH